MSNENTIRRESLKALRKATSALRRKVERERKRQDAIIELHKAQFKLADELNQLRKEENKLFSRAMEEHTNPYAHTENRYP